MLIRLLEHQLYRYIRKISIELWFSGQLLQNDHNELWYRTHIYLTVWDNASLYNKKFRSKRANLYSNITKEFDNVSNQRFDYYYYYV
ncbi:uncharacterized protein BX663DRAFT_494549, partial [Cokeromyces recurvatus]|uniref:uncharacterized protein n=1 Tax=Cokeromyces recurvatus TaxID=90255 RepID=UPI0022208D39